MDEPSTRLTVGRRPHAIGAGPDPADSAGSGYPQLNVEALVKANPDMIFLADTRCCQQSVDSVRARPGWGAVDVEIWDRRRGRTDLTLQLDVLREADGRVRVRFDDLHVL